MGEDPSVVLEYAASRAQQRLWFVEQLAPDTPLHNINVELRFADPVVLPAFEAALDDVVARHEALRTVLRGVDGTLRQVVLAGPVATLLRVTDCSAETEPEAVWARVRAEEAGRPFALDRGPLLRAHLVRVGERDHRLALVVHHTVCDAWSVGVILSDLSGAYTARLAGAPPDWAPLPVQYADFTAWQEGRLASGAAAADLVYWRDRLADLPTLDLTRGRARLAGSDHRGGRVDVRVPAAVRDRLVALATAERATPFMAFTALWAEAVGRWFGSRDVPLGTPVAGRPLGELAGVVGLFVDRLVLRVDTSGRPSARQLIRRVRGVVLDAHDHESVTFEQVVDVVRPERLPGVTPLFQVAVNLVPKPRDVVGSQRSGTLVVDGGQYSNGTVRHDLNLELTDGPDGITGVVEYRFDVVDRADAHGVTELLERLLTHATTDPDRPLHRVPALADPAAAVRVGAPGTEAAERVDAMVAAVARRTPDATAVVAPGVRLTYADLVAHANTVAHTLARSGVGPETAVLLAVPRRAELVVGLLGVLSAGGAYVPVDPAAPAAHVAAVAGDAGARLALVLPDVPVALPDGVDRVELRLDDRVPTDPGPPPNAAGPNTAAYVLFTSGSTGRPKGVVVEHRQLAAYLHACRRLLDPAPGASYLMVQPPTFDSCATTIYGALTTGGTLHLVDADTARDPDALGRYCADHPIDYLKIAPSHLSALLAGGESRLVPRRALVLGGEGCGRRFTRDLAAAGWHVVVHYGPTETTVGVLGAPLTDQTGGDCPTTPLGPPLAGVRAYLLDDQGDPVPRGCPGELFIGGDLVARGYAARPGQTAQVFLPDPFAATPGARMYRTGDVVRALPDGSFEFCGRSDRQVKIAGQRVELGAVEAVLERHHAVRRAVVVPRGAGLVGYVVAADQPTSGGELATRLRDHVAASLPAYCVPAVVVVLDELPHTAHGKLDVSALPDPDPALRPDTPVPPESPVEAALAAVWRRVLHLDEVGVTDRFFDLGGDSIRVIELVAAARRAGVALTARDVFERQTIRELAEHAPAVAGTLPVEAAAGGSDGLGGGVALPGDVAEAVRALADHAAGSAALAPLTAPAGGPPALAVEVVDGHPLLRADPLRVGDDTLAEVAWALAGSAAGRPEPAGPVGPPPGAAGHPATGRGPDARDEDRAVDAWRALLAEAEPVAPGGRGAPATVRRALPAAALAALAGPAHVAHGTVTGDLLVAATASALALGAGSGPVGLLAADPWSLAGGAEPGERRVAPCPVVVAVTGEPDEAIRAAKSAVRRAVAEGSSWAALRAGHRLDDVAVPEPVVRLLDLPPAARFVPDGNRLTVALAGTEVVVRGPDPVVAELADAVVAALSRLCEHCVGHREVYAVEDFPDAGLDAGQLGRLFENLGVDGAAQ